MKDLRCRAARLPIGTRVGRSHIASCLRCQASEARGRMIRRELASLAAEVVAAPPHLAAGVLARLGRQWAPDPQRWVVARLAARYAAAAGVGAAAAVALASGVARRRSRLA